MGSPAVILFVGLPASGKTTFFRTHFSGTHVHVSKDNFPNAKKRDVRQARLVTEALSRGLSVVVDNTNPSPAERAPLITIARAHGARVVGYYFSSRVADSIARNALREGRARVPDVGVLDVAKRLRRPHPSEGFDELYDVTMTNDGFTQEVWQEQSNEE
ncbi:AAA family ATPase [Sorangium sp. So ce363]|uniref:AAA family ATPase n=1 Tax=Sorangium sp. So ce363 TaxID=3133304 RepID=UPI003F605A49